MKKLFFLIPVLMIFSCAEPEEIDNEELLTANLSGVITNIRPVPFGDYQVPIISPFNPCPAVYCKNRYIYYPGHLDVRKVEFLRKHYMYLFNDEGRVNFNVGLLHGTLLYNEDLGAWQEIWGSPDEGPGPDNLPPIEMPEAPDGCTTIECLLNGGGQDS